MSRSLPLTDPCPACPLGPGRKEGFGTAAQPTSRVWYTIAEGNLSQVFYPSLERSPIRRLRFIVAAHGSPPMDDAQEARHEVRWQEPGVPIFKVASTHDEYRLATRYFSDPAADAILVTGDFQPDMPDLHVYVQLEMEGSQTGQVEGEDPPFLMAQGENGWVAMVGPFARAGAGELASTDLFTRLTEDLGRAESLSRSAGPGPLALGAELGLPGGPFVIALGFGESAAAADAAARSVLERGQTAVEAEFVEGWRSLTPLEPNVMRVAGDGGELARSSLAILRSLEDKGKRGAFVASPAAPWGIPEQSYNRIWNRDLCHIATALLDAGDLAAAARALDYLSSLQRLDGSWPQSYRLNGAQVWNGEELDQAGFPILLAWRLGMAGALGEDPYHSLVRPAAIWICRTGPFTQLDRWEDAGGYSPSSLAVAISALVVAALFADEAEDPGAAAHFRLVADYWNDRLEHWTYLGSLRHYVRLGADPDHGPANDAQLSMDFLELARRGLRAAHDPRLENSILVADGALGSPVGGKPAWRRYSGDHYGEAPDGSPWRPGLKAGLGRPWPLLCGERGHYVLARGESPAGLIEAMEAFAGPELMLPEQVWDAESIPSRRLEPGRPTGSAAPLGWAHAEYLSLLEAYAKEVLPDSLTPVSQRYQGSGGGQVSLVWHPGHRFQTVPAGRVVKVQLGAPSVIACSLDGFETQLEFKTSDTGLGLHVADLPTDSLEVGERMEWRISGPGGWDGETHTLLPVEPDQLV